MAVVALVGMPTEVVVAAPTRVEVDATDQSRWFATDSPLMSGTSPKSSHTRFGHGDELLRVRDDVVLDAKPEGNLAPVRSLGRVLGIPRNSLEDGDCALYGHEVVREVQLPQRDRRGRYPICQRNCCRSAEAVPEDLQHLRPNPELMQRLQDHVQASVPNVILSHVDFPGNDGTFGVPQWATSPQDRWELLLKASDVPEALEALALHLKVRQPQPDHELLILHHKCLHDKLVIELLIA
mmetsp:Transcript_54639/g.169306  ORF Transcript_54639/g.169306 Transcript_54639/m.169306 type:complete len:238 (-) Transcript_54639:6-719(-)